MNLIVNGRRSITADTAMRLAHYFGTSAQMWMNLQTAYDLGIAEKKAAAIRKSYRLPSAPRKRSITPAIKNQPTCRILVRRRWRSGRQNGVRSKFNIPRTANIL